MMWLNSPRRRLLVSLLKLTAKGPAGIDIISSDSSVPLEVVDEFLARLAEEDLIEVVEGAVKASVEQRLRLSTLAVKEGVDLEHAYRYLGWGEFEDAAVFALEANHFSTRKHLRFKTSARFEIDVLGFKEPLILSIDCKHWRRSWVRAAFARAVKKQVGRSLEFAKFLFESKKSFRISGWKRAMVMPIILTLSDTPFKVCEQVPIVAIFRFQDFLYNLPTYVSNLASFDVRLETC